MKLGENILKFRKEQKLSQEELAEKMQVARQTILNWELEETMPSAEQVLLLSQIFHKSCDELLGSTKENVVIAKMNSTEKLMQKQVKITKVILLTIYFIVIVSLGGFILYACNLKDFTNKYDSEFVCTLDTNKFYISLDVGGGSYLNQDTHETVYTDNIYKIVINEKTKNGNDTMTISAGYSYKEAIDSLNYVKRAYIKKGATCHSNF